MIFILLKGISINDNILLVSNDQGEYYIPQYGIMTMTDMCPGEAYSVFIIGTNQVEFTYPSMDSQVRAEPSDIYSKWTTLNESSASKSYSDLVVPTGISFKTNVFQTFTDAFSPEIT